MSLQKGLLAQTEKFAPEQRIALQRVLAPLGGITTGPAHRIPATWRVGIGARPSRSELSDNHDENAPGRARPQPSCIGRHAPERAIKVHASSNRQCLNMDYDLNSETRMLLYADRLKRRGEQRSQLRKTMFVAAAFVMAVAFIYAIGS